MTKYGGDIVNLFGQDIVFWVAAAGATVVKLMTSPFHSVARAALNVFAAMFSAYVFTEPALDWLGLNADTYRYAIVALLALTGEGLMRLAIQIVNDPTRALAFLRAWRSGK